MEHKSFTGIRYHIMRGGTSKALFIMKNELPEETAKRDRLLLDILALPELKQKAGMGLDSLSSKIAIISPSERQGVDVDYFFAQADLAKQRIDTSVSCGNILSAVGPYAIETGMLVPTAETTTLGVLSVNTNVVSDVIVQTPSGKVQYKGDVHIDGVPGVAAPVLINFLNSEGSTTGKVLPTGKALDIIDGIEVSCVDAAMPLVIARAADFGKTGYETPAELNADSAMLARMETVRRKAGLLMGLGDVSKLVMPKFDLVAKPRNGTGICSRYFTPASAHTSHAVTGALCLAAACHIKGTVACQVAKLNPSERETVVIEHPAGILTANIEIHQDENGITIPKAAFVRTADLLLEGIYHVS